MYFIYHDLRHKLYFPEIPGNDRHVYHYPEERITSDDDYGTEVYDEDNSLHDSDVEKSNRVPDRANKWYANDGKVAVQHNNASTLTTAATIILLRLFGTLL